MIKISPETITKKNIDNLREWLADYPRLTQYTEVQNFEAHFADWLKTKNAVFVNSGSSAILLALSALREVRPLKKVIVPAVSWATDVSSLLHLGIEPIFCDSSIDDLNMDIGKLEQLFVDHQPDAIISISVMGLAPNMREITRLCDKYCTTLIEDCCEGIGTQINGQKLGTFGAISVFSMYYSHQASSIEGGIVATNDDNMADIVRSMREHGWLRTCSLKYQQSKPLIYGKSMDAIGGLFTFYHPGFNMRNTDLNAFLATEQLNGIDAVIRQRDSHLRLYMKHIKAKGLWVPTISDDSEIVSALGYPMLVKNRDMLYAHLKAEGIESRPLIAGNITRQPFLISKCKHVDLPVADIIHDNGIYLPLHQDMTDSDVLHVVETVLEVAEKL